MCYLGPSELPCSGGGCFNQDRRRAASGTAENMIGESGYFQEGVDGRQKGNKEDWKPSKKLHGGKSPSRRQTESTENQIPDDIHHCRCDYLVESILNKAAKPAPEEPLHFWNDEKRDENWTNQHADRGSDEAVGDDDKRDGLRGRK